MKQQIGKNQNALPEEICEQASFISQTEMNHFMAHAIRKELEIKKQKMRAAPTSAANDPTHGEAT